MSTDLYHTLRVHPCRPQIIQDINLEFPSATTTIPGLRMMDSGPASARSTVKHLTLSNYSFPPQPIGLRAYLDFPSLNKLVLYSCQSIGYLFNDILCNISRCQIRVLKIDQAFSGSMSPGYLGLDKIQTFLQLYTGLDDLVLRGLENIPDGRCEDNVRHVRNVDQKVPHPICSGTAWALHSLQVPKLCLHWSSLNFFIKSSPRWSSRLHILGSYLLRLVSIP